MKCYNKGSRSSGETVKEGGEDLGALDALLRFSFVEGVHFSNRTVLLQGNIGDGTVKYIHAALIELEVVEAPIRISINSGGGDIAAMASIIARIEESKKDSGCIVTTRGVGCVSSAAFLILAAGDKREMSRHASGMFHSLGYGINGKFTEHEVMAKEVGRLTDYWCGWLGERTKKSKKFWLDISREGGDHYFTPKELKRLGVVDKIV